jgi:hypothetical protein
MDSDCLDRCQYEFSDLMCSSYRLLPASRSMPLSSLPASELRFSSPTSCALSWPRGADWVLLIACPVMPFMTQLDDQVTAVEDLGRSSAGLWTASRPWSAIPVGPVEPSTQPRASLLPTAHRPARIPLSERFFSLIRESESGLWGAGRWLPTRQPQTAVSCRRVEVPEGAPVDRPTVERMMASASSWAEQAATASGSGGRSAASTGGQGLVRSTRYGMA